MSPLTATLNTNADSFRSLLNKEENVVIDCLLSGWNYAEIAQELYTTLGEITLIIARVRHKLGIPAGRATKLHIMHDGEMSAKEYQVMTLRAEGLGFKEIAAAMGIAPRTATNHAYNVRRRRRGMVMTMPVDLPGGSKNE